MYPLRIIFPADQVHKAYSHREHLTHHNHRGNKPMTEEYSNTVWPNENDPCWDCGSTIPGHHTELCDLAPEGAVRDLPAVPGTQYWSQSKGKR